MEHIFEIFRGGGDNLAYLLGCPRALEAAVIDPVSPSRIIEYCRGRNLSIKYVLNTHGHPDHTSGNKEVQSSSSARMLAYSPGRAGEKPGLEHGLDIALGELSIRVIHTPGHTRDSVCFMAEDKLFSGDTLFLAGAGNTRFGGDVEDLFKSFEETIIPLPDNVQVCPGHDYAGNNLRFARSMEPGNKNIDKKLDELEDADAEGAVVTSTIGQERGYNPFLRFKEPGLKKSVKDRFPDEDADTPFQVFRLIRELRDNW